MSTEAMTTAYEQLRLQQFAELDTDMVLREYKVVPIEEMIHQIRILCSLPSYRSIAAMNITNWASGCRVEELNNFKVSLFVGNRCYWNRGKNQNGSRYIEFPQWYIEFLKRYRCDPKFKFRNNDLFSMKSATYRRKFDERIRPLLGGNWLAKTPRKKGETFEDEFLYSLGMIRHTWATFHYKKFEMQCGNPAVALAKLQQHLGHNTDKMTYVHYVHDCEIMKKWLKFDWWDILRRGVQHGLDEYESESSGIPVDYSQFLNRGQT